MVGLYYGLKLNYASLLWAEFDSYVKHSKKTIEISSARFWSLILHEVYSQASDIVPEDVEVATFSHLHIPMSRHDDRVVFPTIWCIPDAM